MSIAMYSITTTTGRPTDRRRQSDSMNDRKVIDPPMQNTVNAIDVLLKNPQQIPNNTAETRDVHARKVGPFFTPAFYQPPF